MAVHGSFDLWKVRKSKAFNFRSKVLL